VVIRITPKTLVVSINGTGLEKRFYKTSCTKLF
jgi:hypothetical protein